MRSLLVGGGGGRHAQAEAPSGSLLFCAEKETFLGSPIFQKEALQKLRVLVGPSGIHSLLCVVEEAIQQEFDRMKTGETALWPHFQRLGTFDLIAQMLQETENSTGCSHDISVEEGEE